MFVFDIVSILTVTFIVQGDFGRIGLGMGGSHAPTRRSWPSPSFALFGTSRPLLLGFGHVSVACSPCLLFDLVF